MTPQRFSDRIRVCSLLAFACIFIVSASAQLLVRPKPTELQSIQKQLDPALLPSGATRLVVETAQIFRLTNTPNPDTTIVPVHFRTPSTPESQTTNNCGVFLIPASGPTTFQLLISTTLTPQEECSGGVEAVGSHVPPLSQAATPIFIYRVNTPHGIKYRPTIIRWSYTANAYIANPEGSQYLQQQDHVPTTIKEVLKVWAPVEARERSPN